MKAHAINDRQFAAVADLVRRRSGLALAESRRQQAEAGIRQTMMETGSGDPDRFIARLHTNDRTFQALVENLTVAETYFFREWEQFELLRHTILPELLRRNGVLRLWSAGCASGEEAYSLAMLIEREGLAERTSIVATDISRGALALARKASYGAWSFREGRPDIVAQYFHRRGERLVLCERIRRLVEFGVFNLASELSASRLVGGAGFDVVLCRNVLIYFDPDTIAQVAQRLFASLKDGGWLITGPSDPPLWQHAPFETVVTSAGVVYRRIAGESRKERQWPQQPAAWPQSAAAVRAPVLPNVPAASFSAASSPGKPAEQPAPAPQPLESCIAEVTAFANHSDPVRSGAAIGAALALHPMSAELHYLHAIVQMAAGRYEAAAASLRRALYLDRSMAVAHFALGSVLERRGATEEARRSYRNVLAVCDERRVDDLLPFSEGERAGRLVEAARAQLAHIGDDLVRRS